MRVEVVAVRQLEVVELQIDEALGTAIDEEHERNVSDAQVLYVVDEAWDLFSIIFGECHLQRLDILTIQAILELDLVDLDLFRLHRALREDVNLREGNLLKIEHCNGILHAVLNVLVNTVFESSLVDIIVKVDEHLRADQAWQSLVRVKDTIHDHAHFSWLVVDDVRVNAAQ